MRIAAIGDIHGRPIWKEVAEDALKHADKIVFLGDYIDPYPVQEQKENIITNFIDYGYLYERNNPNFDEEDDESYFEPTKDPTSWDDDFEDDDLNLSDEEFYAKYYPKEKELIYPSFDDTHNTLQEIIDFKKEHKDKVILIIGNHDAHYLFDSVSACSRYDFKNCRAYDKIYRENKDLFQYAYQVGNKLFTHAGVANTWVDFFEATLESYGLKKDNSNIGDVLNKMGGDFLSSKILNAVGPNRNGNSIVGGITWADYDETYRDYLEGFDQYVGHSQVNYIHTESINRIPGSITYCDVLGTAEKKKQNMSLNYKIINIKKEKF